MPPKQGKKRAYADPLSTGRQSSAQKATLQRKQGEYAAAAARAASLVSAGVSREAIDAVNAARLLLPPTPQYLRLKLDLTGKGKRLEQPELEALRHHLNRDKDITAIAAKAGKYELLFKEHTAAKKFLATMEVIAIYYAVYCSSRGIAQKEPSASPA